MKLLLRLYPASWRARYGEEFLALLAQERPGPGRLLDILAGALDAHLNSRFGARAARPVGAPGGFAMIGGLSFRCAAPHQTRAEALRSALGFAGLTIALSALFVLLKLRYGPTLWVETIGTAAFPLSLAVWTAHTYLRGRSWTTRVLFVALVAAITLLATWLARMI